MAPAFIVVAIGVDPSRTLVLSQVVLSFGIPFALVPLIMFTSRRDLMGALVNRRITTVAAVGVAAVIIALNVFLLAQTFGLRLEVPSGSTGLPLTRTSKWRCGPVEWPVLPT